ncbi:MAG: hypothetical protein C5B48_14080 [Candidatus Rokuibacteriota bacterium]|nr:MAG: hypothetical protein C5B48_14080 [Candidatus Rokubacteria bacterium]
MASRSEVGSSWTGWIGFAGVFMIVVGGINFCEGLIAVIRGGYFFQATAEQIIIFDSTAWGVIMILWGLLLMFAGRALLSGASWGRWFAIVAASLNFIIQLSFAGSANYPLWALTGLALSILVLYALIVRWHDATGL